MTGWLLRQRWPLTICTMLAVCACVAAALVLAWLGLAAPFLIRHNPAVACAWTTLAQHRQPFTIIPRLRWTAPLGGRCAPERVQHTALYIEEGIAALIVLRLLLGRVGRHTLRSVWFYVQGVGRLVPGTTHGRARWAGRGDLRAFRARASEPPFVLGVAGRWRPRIVALSSAEQNLNVLIVGQPGVGKSSALFVANMLRGARWRWFGKPVPSRVCTDPKREFYGLTSKAFQTHGYEVRLIDFYDKRGHRYNPLAHIHSPSDAQRFAEMLIDNTGGRSSEQFWDATVILMLVAAIGHLNHLARQAGRDGATLVELANFVGRADYVNVQRELLQSVPEARRAAQQFMANVRKKPELEGSIQAGLPLRFQFLNDPAIAEVTSGDDIDFHAMGRKNGKPWMVYVVVTRGRERVVQPLIVSFFTQMFDVLVQDANAHKSGRLERPVICDLDEAGTIGKIADLAAWLNTLRSAGIWCRLAVQSLAQLVETYGEVSTEAITQACQTFVFFGGSKVDRHDAEWMTRQLGQMTAVQESRNAGRRREEFLVGQGGLVRSEIGTPLMSADDFLRMKRHSMVVVPRHAYPIRCHAVPYSHIPVLRRMAGERELAPFRPGSTPILKMPTARPHQYSQPGVPVQQRPQHIIDWTYDLDAALPLPAMNAGKRGG